MTLACLYHAQGNILSKRKIAMGLRRHIGDAEECFKPIGHIVPSPVLKNYFEPLVVGKVSAWLIVTLFHLPLG